MQRREGGAEIIWCDVCSWHIALFRCVAIIDSYRSHSGHRTGIASTNDSRQHARQRRADIRRLGYQRPPRRTSRIPTRVDALKREWNGASETQRDEFRDWLKTGALKRAARSIADSDGRLRPNVRAFLSHWVTSNRSKPGRIMRDIGFSVFDYTLASALSGKTTLRPAVILKLGDWLKKQGF